MGECITFEIASGRKRFLPLITEQHVQSSSLESEVDRFTESSCGNAEVDMQSAQGSRTGVTNKINMLTRL